MHVVFINEIHMYTRFVELFVYRVGSVTLQYFCPFYFVMHNIMYVKMHYA
jgi:hypothetical protein